jgi:hypothetical protein
MTHHYSSFDGVVMWSGGQTILRQGQSIDENHPLYVERPELFRGLAPVDADLTLAPTPGAVVESTMQTGPGGGRVRKAAGQ